MKSLRIYHYEIYFDSIFVEDTVDYPLFNEKGQPFHSLFFIIGAILSGGLFGEHPFYKKGIIVSKQANTHLEWVLSAWRQCESKNIPEQDVETEIDSDLDSDLDDIPF